MTLDSFHKVLKHAKSACDVCFSRQAQYSTLRIYHDDIASDTRTVTEIEWRKAGSVMGRVTQRTLHGFDTINNAWTRYGAPIPSVDIATRAGLKGLAEFIQSAAIKTKGVPNPQIFSFNPAQI